MDRRLAGVVVGIAVLAAACSSSGSTFDRASPDEVTPTAVAEVEPTPEEAAPAPQVDAPSDPALADVSGLIATAGEDGFRLLSSDGEVVNELFLGDRVQQPTWSRDASRLVATHTDRETGERSVLLLDPSATGDDAATLVPAARPYFFYSWSSDGTRIAALGPGPAGTALDILDADGGTISPEPFDSGSLFLAWEPDGDDLLLNADGRLWLVEGTDDSLDATSLGLAGVPFQAPSWLGGRSVLLVSNQLGPEPAIARLDVDSGELESLGPATPSTFIVVSPDHTDALLAHPPVQSDTLPASTDVATEILSTLELLDLETGSRTAVGDTPTYWAEWSPDGTSLLLGSNTTDALGWDLWTDGELVHLADYRPSLDFLQNYIRFAPAFIESPRLWSPDSSAVTYGAQIDGVDTAVALRVGDGGVQVPLGPSQVSFWSPVAVG